MSRIVRFAVIIGVACLIAFVVYRPLATSSPPLNAQIPLSFGQTAKLNKEIGSEMKKARDQGASLNDPYVRALNMLGNGFVFYMYHVNQETDVIFTLDLQTDGTSGFVRYTYVDPHGTQHTDEAGDLSGQNVHDLEAIVRTIVDGKPDSQATGAQGNTGCVLPSAPNALGQQWQIVLRAHQDQVTPEQLAETRQLIEQRMCQFGASDSNVTIVGSNQINVDFAVNEHVLPKRVETLLIRGILEFIDPQGQDLARGALVRTTRSPDVKLTRGQLTEQERNAAQDGPQYPVIAHDGEIKRSSVQKNVDAREQSTISFEFEGASAAELERFTKQNAGNFMAITLDNQVVINAMILDVLPGMAQFQCDPRECDGLVAVLRTGPLPIPLTIESSRQR